MFTGVAIMDETRSTFLVRLKDRTDQEAWQVFDQLYRPILVRYACDRGLDHAGAADIFQQCAQAVLKHIDNYQHTGSFRAWLRTIVDNKVRDLLRSRRPRQADTGLLACQADPQPGPEQIWEQVWLTEHLRYCVEKVRSELADNTYAAFMAFAIEGQPAAVVAEKLGLSMNSVYVAKHRVIERIRRLMVELTGSDAIELM